MRAYYGITTKIKELLEVDPAINTVTKGDITEIDLTKQTLYGLGHIMINEARPNSQNVEFSISVLVADVVDVSSESPDDKFIGNDNEDDVLNTMLAVISRLTEQLRRGSVFDEGYQTFGGFSCEPFTDRFENKIAGWVATFDVTVSNTMTIC